jgi:glutamate racemase
MVRIAVFDSGLGSLSIIKEIQKITKTEIIYFGDQEHYPYGEKSKSELEKIIKKSIKMIKDTFSPDLIIMGSNTPTVRLNLEDDDIIGVKPPLKETEKITKTKNIGILGTRSAVQSKELSKLIKNSNLDPRIKIHRINGSSLVELVESGKFLTNKTFCKKVIKEELECVLAEKNIDVVTLSSTHLPFLRTYLEEQFPNVVFVDPASLIAKKIHEKIGNDQGKQNKLKIFSSGNVEKFQKNLYKLGVKNKVNFLKI